jgi:hypothetical protein
VIEKEGKRVNYQGDKERERERERMSERKSVCREGGCVSTKFKIFA